MQQAAFEVIGGKRLSGNIEVQGAKKRSLRNYIGGIPNQPTRYYPKYS